MNFQQLKHIIKKAGIVGAGGAGFPLHTKLNIESEYIIINGAECEPLLTVDQQLMDKYALDLVKALDVIIKAVGAKTGIIGLKKQYKKARASLEAAIDQYPHIKIHNLPNIYPSGDESTLIYECIGRVVPRGALPITQGVTVMNVETLLNAGGAIFYDKSVTHTYITIGGDVPNPITVKVPLGMKVGELVRLAGRDIMEQYELIMGGPMTGNIVSKDAVVTKTTKGILVLKSDHYIVTRKKPVDFTSLKKIMSACSQCRMCTDLCPRNILGHKVEPHKLMNSIANGLVEHSEACETALGCCGCNLCSLYSCHHDLAPAEFMMTIKNELIKNGIRSKEDKKSLPDQWRQYRQVPSGRLLKKIGLASYDVDAPLNETTIEPRWVEIPLKQHIGASAIPCVKIGDNVKQGQLIGNIEEGLLGALIHASISGVVTNINENSIRIERGM